MLAHAKQMLECSKGQVAIHPMIYKVIHCVNDSSRKGDGMLDKENTSHDDCFDAFRLSLMFWHQ